MMVLYGRFTSKREKDAELGYKLDTKRFSLQTMTDKEKQRFYEMAEMDKKRYDTEMSGYRGPRQSRTARKRRNRKDPNAPKRAL